MNTARVYVPYSLTEVSKGKVNRLMRQVGDVRWNLREAKASLNDWSDPLDECGSEIRADVSYRKMSATQIVRMPTEYHGPDIIEWLRKALRYPKYWSKRSYMVVSPLDGNEAGIDWLVGVFGTMKSAKDAAGHLNGRLIGVLHYGNKKDVVFEKPPPIQPDLWGVEA